MPTTKKPTEQPAQATPFAIIGRFSIDANWNGSPTTLLPSQNVNMPRTTDGSMVFAYENKSTQNSQGTLSITSGGGAPSFLSAPALANQPSILAKNWQANNLSVTNISPPGSNTPILIRAIGPGMPGQKTLTLPTDGTSVNLRTYQSAQGKALPQWMQLILQLNESQSGTFALIGGPVDGSGNNAYVFAVNAAANTGPGTGVPPPAGYYATTTSNYDTYQFNWGSSTIFVVNLSSETAQSAEITLRIL